MQTQITNQKEYNDAVKKRLHITGELVIQNTREPVIVHTDVTVGKNGHCKTDIPGVVITAKENGIVSAEGKVQIIGRDNANIIAKGNCKVTLHDEAFGNCFDHCKVMLRGKSKINADGNCTVYALDESCVSASGSSKVYTSENAMAQGKDFTSLEGRNTSTLTGTQNCSIKARDNCIVYAYDNCTVEAGDNCLVVADKTAKVISEDNCLIMSKNNPNISVAGKCEHINLTDVTDKNIMGTLKQMAQSKAVSERPYIAVQILKDNILPERKEAVNRRLNTMGLKDQVAVKNHLYSLIESEPVKNLKDQLALAHKAGYVQGVCESVAVVGQEHALAKKILTEMNVTRDMANKYARPETIKTLEQGIFAQQQNRTQEQGIKR
jgi:hypothetical protein